MVLQTVMRTLWASALLMPVPLSTAEKKKNYICETEMILIRLEPTFQMNNITGINTLLL